MIKIACFAASTNPLLELLRSLAAVQTRYCQLHQRCLWRRAEGSWCVRGEEAVRVTVCGVWCVFLKYWHTSYLD